MVGVTTMLVVVSDVFHKYVSPPKAVSVVLSPRHKIVFPLMLTSGRGFTFMVISSVFVHPFASVPVTV